MTYPVPLSPHQDPTPQLDANKVSIIEFITTLIAALDRRFDTVQQDLMRSMGDRFDASTKLATEADLRYQQRFDAQKEALTAALTAQKEAVAVALLAAEKATTKAELAADKRFDCVAVDTLILCEGGLFQRAGDLVAGDVVFTLVEDLGDMQLRPAIVIDNSVEEDNVYEVTTPSGTLHCTADHPWMARQIAQEPWAWVKTSELGQGWSVYNNEVSDVAVLSVKPAGRKLVARLGTSEHTYIAAGFAMHNSVNEFRGQLADQAASFIPRTEADSRFLALDTLIASKFDALTSKIDDLKAFQAATTGRGKGINQSWGVLVGAVGLIATCITIFVLLLH